MLEKSFAQFSTTPLLHPPPCRDVATFLKGVRSFYPVAKHRDSRHARQISCQTSILTGRLIVKGSSRGQGCLIAEVSVSVNRGSVLIGAVASGRMLTPYSGNGVDVRGR